MAEITLKINHRGYSMSCDEGQEGRLTDLAAYVNSHLSNIATAGAASNESHLLVLTSLVLADEVFDMRDEVAALQEKLSSRKDPVSEGVSNEDEEKIVEAIDYLANKIERIAGRLDIPSLTADEHAA